jgi:hypothetical protein
MKFLLPLLLALPAFAADHLISWQANPTNEAVLAYIIYEQVGSVWTRKLDVSAPQTNGTLFSVTTGWHVYAVSATNALGVGPMSLPVSAFVPVFPTPPTNVIVNLRASVDGVNPGVPLERIVQYWLPVQAEHKSNNYRGVTQLSNTNLLTNIDSGQLKGSTGVWALAVSIPSTTRKHYSTTRIELAAIK